MSKKSLEERISALEDQINGSDTLTTRVLIIQDRSGSMGSRVQETIDGYNEYIATLQEDDSDEAFLTLVQFDNRYEVKVKDKPVGRVPQLNRDTFVPRGMTRLLDAVGRSLSEFKETVGKTDRALVVIMTDGGENDSREWDSHKVSDLITELEDTDRYTFIFMGAGRDAWSGGRLMGLSKSQYTQYGSSAHDHRIAYASLGAATRGFRGQSAMSVSNLADVHKGTMAAEGAEEVILDFDAEETASETPPKARSTSRG